MAVGEALYDIGLLTLTSVAATIPVPGSVDATVIDAAARRAHVGGKPGVVDLDSNTVLAKLPSEKNAHTLAVDTDTHAVTVHRNESNKVDLFEMDNPD